MSASDVLSVHSGSSLNFRKISCALTLKVMAVALIVLGACACQGIWGIGIGGGAGLIVAGTVLFAVTLGCLLSSKKKEPVGATSAVPPPVISVTPHQTRPAPVSTAAGVGAGTQSASQMIETSHRENVAFVSQLAAQTQSMASTTKKEALLEAKRVIKAIDRLLGGDTCASQGDQVFPDELSHSTVKGFYESITAGSTYVQLVEAVYQAVCILKSIKESVDKKEKHNLLHVFTLFETKITTAIATAPANELNAVKRAIERCMAVSNIILYL
ncbi:MAG: hypothetical protein S4CHLAM2_11490 [Chlamydiales bacterium]|nr:hypothetical protein [Chlamydiales bacterium]